jgi:hypothetical protein
MPIPPLLQILKVWFPNFHSMDCHLSSFFPTMWTDVALKNISNIYSNVWRHMKVYYTAHWNINMNLCWKNTWTTFEKIPLLLHGLTTRKVTPWCVNALHSIRLLVRHAECKPRSHFVTSVLPLEKERAEDFFKYCLHRLENPISRPHQYQGTGARANSLSPVTLYYGVIYPTHYVFHFITIVFMVLIFLSCVYICIDMLCTFCGWISIVVYIYL